MRISDLPAHERPRERLSAMGAHHLADRELLAMVLGTGGTRGAGAHDLAERLLNAYGSVPDLARAHACDLARIPGIGVAKASAVVSAFELARRTGRSTEPRPVLGDTLDLHALVRPLLVGHSRERLVLVICDATHRAVHYEVLTDGSADRAAVPIREIIVAVLRRDGHAFALAHNHPDGDPTPSRTDIESTARLHGAATALGLSLLEHIVVTDTTWRTVPLPGDSV